MGSLAAAAELVTAGVQGGDGTRAVRVGPKAEKAYHQLLQRRAELLPPDAT